MKPPAFAYYTPGSIDDALKLLHELVQEQKRDVKLLAGGQSLLPLLNLRLVHPEVVIDLNRLEPWLSYVHEEEGVLHIGALTRHHQLRTHPAIRRHCPLLADAAGLIGHVAIQTRGTLGGSLVHADPAAELPLVLTTLSGTITLHSAQQQRKLKASDFFLSYLTANIEAYELLTEATIPMIPARTGQAIEEFSLRHGDFALAAAAAQITLDTTTALQQVRLCIGGVAPTPVDCSHVLAPLLNSIPQPDALREVLHDIRGELDPIEDIHASTAYRLELAETLAYRALNRAIQAARTTSVGK